MLQLGMSYITLRKAKVYIKLKKKILCKNISDKNLRIVATCKSHLNNETAAIIDGLKEQ